MNNQFLYNTDVYLWKNKRVSMTSCPNGGEKLQVRSGHVCGGFECFARFADDEQAKKTLVDAGFKEVEPNIFKALPI